MNIIGKNATQNVRQTTNKQTKKKITHTQANYENGRTQSTRKKKSWNGKMLLDSSNSSLKIACSQRFYFEKSFCALSISLTQNTLFMLKTRMWEKAQSNRFRLTYCFTSLESFGPGIFFDIIKIKIASRLHSTQCPVYLCEHLSLSLLRFHSSCVVIKKNEPGVRWRRNHTIA